MVFPIKKMNVISVFPVNLKTNYFISWLLITEVECLRNNFQCSGKTSPKGHHSIGLANVNQRLHSYYGEEYGLLVESIPGEGTIIDIVLPSSAINIEPSFFQPELSKTISLSQNPSQ